MGGTLWSPRNWSRRLLRQDVKQLGGAWGWLTWTPLLPAELHKISLSASSWPHHHFPKTLYFYKASCLLAISGGLKRVRWPRRWPLPAPLPSLLSVSTGGGDWAFPEAFL